MRNNKKKIKEIILKEFESYDYIEFSILFGSFSEGKEINISDIDIGIYLNKDLTLIEIGFIISELESKLKKKIDLIILNEIYKKSPLFAYNVVTKGELIFNRNEKKYVDYKRKIFLNYFDTAYLRDMINETFRQRIESGSAGDRNYA